MKLRPCLAPVLALGLFGGPAAAARIRRGLSGRRDAGTEAIVAADAGGRSDVSLEAQTESMVEQFLQGKGPRLADIAAVARRRMQFKEAAPRLEGRLPQTVMSLVHEAIEVGDDASKAKAEGKFSEVSLAKARVYMNGMMYDAWLELDSETIQCKEFEESNRETFGQVVTDLEHIASDLADRSRMKVEAEGGVAEMSLRMKEADMLRGRLKREYFQVKAQNNYELRLRKDDQDVFDAVLNMTKCPNEGDNSYSLAQVRICVDSKGGQHIVTEDPALLATLKKTPKIEAVLISMFGDAPDSAGGGDALLQLGAWQAPPPEPVKKDAGAGLWKVCRSPADINCGLLHDTMALQWGKFKDAVDELSTLMEHNFDVYNEQMDNLNSQIGSLRADKALHQEMLAESVSEMNSLTAATREKETQQRELTEAYNAKMLECKKKISEILFTNICAVRVVRNQLMAYSETTPPEKILDCDFTDWAPGQCSVDCDDGCPDDVSGHDINDCGGTQSLSREMVASPNKAGMACPPMGNSKKCNQFKCPVNCVMSEWSGWSSCSKECGGGTMGKTRGILQKPKNGGSECDTTIEEKSCHTGSCDRDCSLAEWTKWEPCSVACGGGFQKRVRKVDIPIRANGKCPKKDHPDRMQMQACNTQWCTGDELCIALQDLIIAVDGSGSLREDGFEILRELALNLTGRYASKYYGREAVRVGVVLFGNGEYKWQGYVEEAIEAHPLSSDLESVKSAIAGLEWQRGFTNMMQALKKADGMFEKYGRQTAQSAIIVIGDGKYTNVFRTTQTVQKMKDQGIQIHMAPVQAFESDSLKILKGWASEPWETNYERIPGLAALMNNEADYAERLLVKFCPNAVSPTAEANKANVLGYMKLVSGKRPDPTCGASRDLGDFDRAGDTASAFSSCIAAVKAEGSLMFSFRPRSDAGRGECRPITFEVDEDVWSSYLMNRTDFTCPEGELMPSEGVTTYMLDPGPAVEDLE